MTGDSGLFGSHQREVGQIYNFARPTSHIRRQFGPTQTTKERAVGAINMLGLNEADKRR